MKTLYIISLICSFSFAKVINVPADQSTIQDAINASDPGDTVLVAPSEYFENINFNGKNIVLASHFILEQDISFITSTIINGSQPSNKDNASCVRIISGEDSTCVLTGFTLTGGTGTKWVDEHGAGTYYEGGGILIALSSPTIKHNFIFDNEAIRTGRNVVSAGGGGIRAGDGNPIILNNVFMSNKGMYGAGLVLNYSGGNVRNNIFYNNRVYRAVNNAPTFGGGGIWINNSSDKFSKVVINNTIVGNISQGETGTVSGKGGGISIFSTNVDVRNNLIWGNTQDAEGQVFLFSSTSSVFEFNNIEDTDDDQNNIKLYPQFADSQFYTNETSLCIDAGDTTSVYNDFEDEQNPGFAKLPAQGSLRNDIGAYGGAHVLYLSAFKNTKLNIPNKISFSDLAINDSASQKIRITNNSTYSIRFDSVKIKNNQSTELSEFINFTLLPFQTDSTIKIKWKPLIQENLDDTLLVFHNDSNIQNPYKIPLEGTIVTSLDEENLQSPHRLLLKQNFPNPFNPVTTISFEITETEWVELSVFNVLGEKIITLINEEKNSGSYTVKFRAENLSSGVYFYKLSVGKHIFKKKMLLIK